MSTIFLITGVSYFRQAYPTVDVTVGASVSIKSLMRFKYQSHTSAKISFYAIVSESAEGFPGK